MAILTYRTNPTHTKQAAYCGRVRIGYVDKSADDRWLWSLNTIQPEGGRATGISGNEQSARSLLETAWMAWLDAAGLEIKREIYQGYPSGSPRE
jgi:hypothetical protein